MRPEVAANDAMESLVGRLMECGPENGGQKPRSDSSRQQGPSSQGSGLALLLVSCCHSCRVHEEQGCVSFHLACF
ncbi:hypothetical protein PS1_000309 [Malus domestica]